MAINWIAAFKLIPWSDVVQATPTVVRSAKGLWARATKTSTDANDSNIIDKGSLEQRMTQLESEQLEASALISTLAEHNAQLVAALENLRARIRALFAVCVLLALASVALWLR